MVEVLPAHTSPMDGEEVKVEETVEAPAEEVSETATEEVSAEGTA